MKLIKADQYWADFIVPAGGLRGGEKIFRLPLSEGVDLIEITLNYSSQNYSVDVHGFIDIYTIDDGVLSRFNLYIGGGDSVGNTKTFFIPVIGNDATLEYEHTIKNDSALAVNCSINVGIKYLRSVDFS